MFHNLSKSLLADLNAPARVVPAWAIIPTKIMIDVPFPIPYSVILSDSHITIQLPPTRIVAINVYVRYALPLSLSSKLENNGVIFFLKATITPIACTIANTIAIYLVIWVILSLPASPSFVSLCKLGITIDKSWIIINALINGKIPKEKRVPCANEPPDNVDNTWTKFNPESLLAPKAWVNVPPLKPGIGINEPTLKIKTINNVIHILILISLDLNAFFIVSSIFFHPLFQSFRLLA